MRKEVFDLPFLPSNHARVWFGGSFLCWILYNFSYSLAQLRALGVRHLMLLLAARQEVAKKRAKAFPLGSPCRSPF